ncbi:hypothetical protein [Bradyrhizobium sp.]|uniref:hypothetical protein n=1 Tax=Bradyrhizobium sp. TaxID=376 RepID=UPI003C707FB4
MSMIPTLLFKNANDVFTLCKEVGLMAIESARDDARRLPCGISVRIGPDATRGGSASVRRLRSIAFNSELK